MKKYIIKIKSNFCDFRRVESDGAASSRDRWMSIVVTESVLICGYITDGSLMVSGVDIINAGK